MEFFLELGRKYTWLPVTKWRSSYSPHHLAHHHPHRHARLPRGVMEEWVSAVLQVFFGHILERSLLGVTLLPFCALCRLVLHRLAVSRRYDVSCAFWQVLTALFSPSRRNVHLMGLSRLEMFLNKPNLLNSICSENVQNHFRQQT